MENLSTPTTFCRHFVSVGFLSLGLVLAGCASASSTGPQDNPLTETTDPVLGDAVLSNSVENGTEGGLDLDNGNVPGSDADQEADKFEELPGNDDE